MYAIGWRCLLASDLSVSFMDADTQVSKFFQNAMSVFSEIIFGHTGLTAVQAVILMVCVTLSCTRTHFLEPGTSLIRINRQFMPRV